MAFSFNTDYTSPSPPSDEISIFLRQLLHRSSSSSPAVQPSSLPSTLDHSPYLNVGLSSPSPAPLSNLRSSSEAPVESDSLTAGTFQLRSSDNDADDYDCESEEGPDPKRNSSKRSRAAEVHNLSEKRRRSRINEKMKALQNLIPNCNKTDKASMLDEAIEYLKQLQLQVQMLSMRNGLILHPMCLPGFPDVLDPDQLSQLGLNLSNRDGSSHPTTIANTLPSVPRHQCDPLTRPCLDSLPGIINDEPPFSLDSSMANHLGSFNLPTSSQVICREDTASQNQLAGRDSQTNVLSRYTESWAPISSAPSKFSSEPLYLTDDLQGVLQSNSTSHAHLVSSYLDGLCQGTTEFDTRVSSGILDRES